MVLFRGSVSFFTVPENFSILNVLTTSSCVSGSMLYKTKVFPEYLFMAFSMYALGSTSSSVARLDSELRRFDSDPF